MPNYSLGILKVGFFIAPFPIFFDLKNYELMVNFPIPGDFSSFFRFTSEVPIPFVFFVVLYFYFSNILKLLALTGRLKIISKNALFLLLFIFTVFSLVFLWQELNFRIILQLFLFLFLIVFLPKLNPKVSFSLAKYYLFGIFSWVSLHFASILSTNNFSILEVDRYYNYGTVFGFQIYQSLVSYPATMSLFIIYLIFCIFHNIFNSLFLIITGALVIFIGLFSATRMFQFDILFLSFLAIYQLFKRLYRIRVYLFISVIFCILLFGFNNYSERLLTQGGADRFELISKAIIELSSNPSYIFFGSGTLHSYAHNYVLNLLLNYGFLLSGTFIISTVVIFRKIWFRLAIPPQKKPFLAMLLGIIFSNSAFNSAITQPLFVCNALIIFFLIVSPIQMNHRG